ncbi:hypothetical protein LJC31_06115 [Synergistaceae bacterium OttesenSCG-928-I11]|nr:hypothetical protein [Synergistaceae bacterium OttesenSCG-928-I11]
MFFVDHPDFISRRTNMIYELCFNAFLLLVAVVCVVDVSANAPPPLPGSMSAAQWPQIVFGLMCVFIVINMIYIWKNRPDNVGEKTAAGISSVVPKKLVVALLILFSYIFFT